MSESLLVTTRKGLFILARARSAKRAVRGQRPVKKAPARTGLGSGWSFVRSAFVGDPVSMALHDPRNGTLYAALNLGHFGCKLHRSRDEGVTWEECAVPAYPAAKEGAPGDTLALIWTLEAGGTNEPGVLWAGTIPGGLFRSADSGTSWVLNEALWARPERADWIGGGYDHAGIHWVCVDARDARRITVGVSCGGVWVTADGGSTWACRADGMRAAYLPPEQAGLPHVQDPHRVVQSPAKPEVLWAQHHNGIFRTVDGGGHWQELSAEPSTFGFAAAVHPRKPDTAWFVPAVADVCRIPVDGRMVVSRTEDGGRTFETFHKGLPQRHAYHLVYRHGLAVDGTGRRLAMGSTTGELWTSDDGGESWQAVSAHLPPIYAVRFVP